MHRLFILLLCLFAFVPVYSQAPADGELTILFAGDAMQHIPQMRAANGGGGNKYCYSDCFRFIKPYLEQSRFCVVNFETTLADEPYSGFPRFSAPDDWFYALRDAGFRFFALANNHILDHGNDGLLRTLDIMGVNSTASSTAQPHQHEAFVMGAYSDTTDRRQRYPVVFDAGGVRVALFNYTYGTNGMRVVPPVVVNLLDTALIKADLESVKDMQVDVKIVYLHWGDEYRTCASRNQRKMARWLVRQGFDAVIGSHPHVVQDGEWIEHEVSNQPSAVSHQQAPTARSANQSSNLQIIKSSNLQIRRVPVVYSLGNLMSNQRKTGTNGGIMAQVVIDTKTKRVTDLRYLPFYVHRGYISRPLVMGNQSKGNKLSTFNFQPSTLSRYQYYAIPTDDYLEGRMSFVLPKYVETELRALHDSITGRMSEFSILRLRTAFPITDYDDMPSPRRQPLPPHLHKEF